MAVLALKQCELFPVTEAELQDALFRAYGSNRYSLFYPNLTLSKWFECDFLGIRKSGFVDEIEIKLTRSDFLADFKKGNGWKHRRLEVRDCVPNYFSFCMPEELVDKAEIPDYAGLYIYRTDPKVWNRLIEVKNAPRLHGRKIEDRERLRLGQLMNGRYWSLRTARESFK